ncbi:hypothetical protein JX265_007443 [Neoarthrinium moseri]|uniref:Uncharacterized protein n=1 Tax=Neoarthrinium moseri TaxID=1658444 RepID=A0A9P9WK70_9PEZI|nr:uncharacterized protein JN550_009165 [Neoarthrinium moseri]KAI1864145.1 hypothetical protein JN550_009165 [Neoarthrinium moseri]KAI1867641.1 hypothetical protein JX265_007443 [Neoarthrinium moseri]
MPSISGQSVLILGGSSGIGFSVAKLCLEQSARVAIASSSQTKVEDAVKRLLSQVSQARYEPKGYTIDLNSQEVEEHLQKLFLDVTSKGTELLDHIVVTAGKPDFRSIKDASLSHLAKTAQMPVFVPVLVAKVGTKFLREGYSSSIIFTSGQLGEKPMPGYSAFAGHASAQYGLTRNLAVDLAPRRVNAVAPGATETELWGEHAEMLRDMASKSSLLGKPGSPEEVAEAYIYLMRNTDATGSIVSSNGGATLK